MSGRSRNGSISASSYSKSLRSHSSHSSNSQSGNEERERERARARARESGPYPTLSASSSSSSSPPISSPFYRNFNPTSSRSDVSHLPSSSHFHSSPSSNSDPTSSSSQSESSSQSNRPKLVLSLEITESSISAVCIILEEKLLAIFDLKVVLDQEFPEYKTVNGSYTSASNDGNCSLTPIGMVVKGIDRLLEKLKLNQKIDLRQVVAIGVTGDPHFPVLLSENAPESLRNLSPEFPLSVQLDFPNFFTLPFLPNQNDESASAEFKMIQANFEQTCLLTRDKNATTNSARKRYLNLRKESEERSSHVLGSSPVQSFLPSQLSKIRNGHAIGFVGEERVVDESWEKSKHLKTIGSFLFSVLVGQLGKVNEVEATYTGLYNPKERRWEGEILNYVSAGQAEKLKHMLGNVQKNEDAEVDKVGRWLVDRFGFDPDCIVTTSLPSNTSTFLSFLPKQRDAILKFGKINDHLMASSEYVSSSQYSIVPNPIYGLFSSSSSATSSASIDNKDNPLPWLMDFRSLHSSQARKIARDNFCNGKWNVLSHMCSITPSGGSIGLDNKMFTISVPKGPNKGIRRFEHGVRVAEFSDTRVNSRCLVEGQALTMRAILSKLAFENGRQPSNQAYLGSGERLGFNPFCEELAPSRVFTDGKASGNKSISKIYSDCLGCDMIVSRKFVEEIQRDEEIEPLEKISSVDILDEVRSRSDSFSTGSGENYGAKSSDERERLFSQLNDRLQRKEEVQPSRSLIGAAYFAIFHVENLSKSSRDQPLSGFNETIRSFYSSDLRKGRVEDADPIQVSRKYGNEGDEDDFKTPKAGMINLEPEEQGYKNYGLVAAASSWDDLTRSDPNLRIPERDPFSPNSTSNLTGTSRRPENLRRQRSFTLVGNEHLDGNRRSDKGTASRNLLSTTDHEIIKSHVENLESILNSADVLGSNLEYLEREKENLNFGQAQNKEKEKADLRIRERKIAKAEVKARLEREKEDLAMLGLVKLTERDDDSFAIYGGLLEEFVRLSDTTKLHE